MPYKDAEQRKLAVQKSKSKWSGLVQVKFSLDDSALFERLQTAAGNREITAAEYMRVATREKLIRDGYLRED